MKTTIALLLVLLFSGFLTQAQAATGVAPSLNQNMLGSGGVTNIPSTGNQLGMPYFKIPPSDISYQGLQMVFGPVIGKIATGKFFSAIPQGFTAQQAATDPTMNGQGGSVGSLMGSYFGVFNIAIMFVAAVMIFWHTLTAIIRVADSGEMGENVSAFWAPVRVVMSMGFLLPVLGGYSVIQGVILWVGLQGVGVADAASSAVTSEFTHHPIVAQPSTPQGAAIAQHVLAAQTCAAYMNHTMGPMIQYGIQKPDGTTSPRYTQADIQNGTVPMKNWLVVDHVTTFVDQGNGSGVQTSYYETPTGQTYGRASHTVRGAGFGGSWVERNWQLNAEPGSSNPGAGQQSCGSVRLSIPFRTPNLGGGVLGIGGLLGQVQSPKSLYSVEHAMYAGTLQGMSALVVNMQPIAQAVAAGNEPFATANQTLESPTTTAELQAAQQRAYLIRAVGTDYAQAVVAYNQSVTTAAATAMRGLIGSHNASAMQSAIADQGWLAMGSLWLSMAKTDEAVARLVSDHPTFGGPTIQGAGSRLPYLMAQSRSLGGALHASYSQVLSQTATSQPAIGTDAATTFANAASLWQGGFVDKIKAAFSYGAGAVETGVHAAGEVAHGVGWVLAHALAAVENVVLESLGANAGSLANGPGAVAAAAIANLGGGNPVVRFMYAGQRLIDLTAGLLIGWVALMGAGAAVKTGVGASVVAKIPVIGSALVGLLGQAARAIGPVILALALYCFGLGVLLGVYIPTVIEFSFIVAAVGWLLMLAQTVMAGPLFALSHANIEGESWAPERAMQGYQMIAGLALRPVMIVGALLFAMAIMTASAWIASVVFGGYVAAFGVGSTLGGVIMSSVLILTFCLLLAYLSHLAARMITSIPDEVLQFIGGGRDPLGGADRLTQQHSTLLARIGGGSHAALRPNGGDKEPESPGADGAELKNKEL